MEHPEDDPSITDHGNLATEARRRVLEAEKKRYWRQYHMGFLGSDSVRFLVESADLAIDNGSRLNQRTELENLWKSPGFL